MITGSIWQLVCGDHFNWSVCPATCTCQSHVRVDTVARGHDFVHMHTFTGLASFCTTNIHVHYFNTGIKTGSGKIQHFANFIKIEILLYIYLASIVSEL